MPLAQEARKPMFALKAADGAIGGHAAAVEGCYRDFQELAGNGCRAGRHRGHAPVKSGIGAPGGALAIREGCPSASLDRRLSDAAAAEGVAAPFG